ncbi:MAG: type II toxin-antitoxin system HicA family toxin [Acidobacteriota bacterium]|jgi:hypothetical protein|nr:type II toxin-antitoxin system HicA family toxin [Acidobacteriota bacterium]
MKTKHRKTLAAIFDSPTRANIAFSDIEAMVAGMGGEVVEREGSRVVLSFGGGLWHAHRPHPGREAKKYQVESLREFLRSKGVEP